MKMATLALILLVWTGAAPHKIDWCAELCATGNGICSATCLLAALPVTPALEALELELLLVPKTSFDKIGAENTSGLRTAALPPDQGTAYLHRIEDSSPPTVVSTKNPIRIDKAGEWLLIAEAPGWVTAEPVRIVTSQEGLEERKRIFWPVVPACPVGLGKPEPWRGLLRTDFVSLEHGSVHRLDLGLRRALMVPAGRFLYYTVGPRGLAGISGILRCAPGEQLTLDRPDLPQVANQDVMLPLVLPETKLPLELEDLRVEFRASGKRALEPTALVRGSRTITAFFPNLPAGKEGTLVAAHPKLVTERVKLDPQGGTARELGEIALRLGKPLELTINYVPIRKHVIQRLEVSRCSKPSPGRPGDLCTNLIFEIDLKAGIHEYRIDPLDDGRYRVDAVIDDDRVLGLGDGVMPILKNGEAAREYSPIELREFEIFGQILFEGEPVPGELILQTTVASQPPRRFPTGEGLLFTIPYFGRSIVQRDPMLKLPDEDSRPIEESLGIDRMQEAIACTLDGKCRSLRPAVLRGGGRLDVEVAIPPRVSFTVTDQSTGEALSGAEVSADGYASKRLVFLNGDADWRAKDTSGELVIHRTRSDRSGNATLYGVPDDLRGISVKKDGYRSFSKDFEGVSLGEALHLDVELEPKGGRGNGTRLLSSHGERLATALVVSLASGGGIGTLDQSCSEIADNAGEVFLDRECLEGRNVLVLDPRVRLKPISGDLLLSKEQIEVEGIDGSPPRIRIIDESGAPPVALPVRLVLQGLDLSPNDLIHAYGMTRRPWPYTTGDVGLLTILGVDHLNADGGEVVIGVGDAEMRLSLQGMGPGELREVVYSPGS